MRLAEAAWGTLRRIEVIERVVISLANEAGIKQADVALPKLARGWMVTIEGLMR